MKSAAIFHPGNLLYLQYKKERNVGHKENWSTTELSLFPIMQYIITIFYE